MKFGSPASARRLYERATAVHGPVQVIEDLGASGCPHAVGVGHQAESGRAVDRPPTESPGADVVVDGHAHPGARGQVVERAAGRREIEVEQPDRMTTAEYDILQADVVVADDRSTVGIRQFGTPLASDEPDPLRGLVERPEQPRDRGERLVPLRPVGEGWERDLAVDEDEALPAVVLDPDRERGAPESGGAELDEESVDRRRVAGGRAEDDIAVSGHPAGVRHPALQDLVHTPVSQGVPRESDYVAMCVVIRDASMPISRSIPAGETYIPQK